MPTMRLLENDKDYAIVGALPVDAPELLTSMEDNLVILVVWSQVTLMLETLNLVDKKLW